MMIPFMLSSNIFLAIPVVIAFYKSEWIYFFFALGLFIFSPLYHFFDIYNDSSNFLQLFRALDWINALGAYIYMYYFIFFKLPKKYRIFLFVFLTLTVIFFIYGYKFGNYEIWHPYFHILAPIVSGLIVYYAK